jgi:signal transduction histidine kinase
MSNVGPLRPWRARCAQAGRRIVAVPHAPALAVGLLGVLAAAQALVQGNSVPLGGFGTQQIAVVLLSLCTTLPLGLLWPQPAAAALAISAASVLSLALFHTLTVAGLVTLLVILYRLGRHGSRQLLAAGLAMPYLVLALASPGPAGERVINVLLASLAPVSAWSGIAFRSRHEAAQHSAAREVIAGSLVEHTARGERARISRELHDVVAHHISMIAIQAETTRLTTPGMPAAGAQRLSAIGDTSRAALTEMRRLLGVLREDADAVGADRQPQPGLRHLNPLLDEARDASNAGTRLIVQGWATALDPGVELAAYRIVQESLTNARRHAPGAAVDVEVHYTDGELLVRIRDNGPGPPDALPAGSHGLLGMRERAAAVGGALRTGLAAGGGFLVEATLPAVAATLPSVESASPAVAATLPEAASALPAGKAS